MDFQHRTQNVEVGTNFDMGTSQIQFQIEHGCRPSTPLRVTIYIDPFEGVRLSGVEALPTRQMKNAPIRGIGYWLAKEVVS